MVPDDPDSTRCQQSPLLVSRAPISLNQKLGKVCGGRRRAVYASTKDGTTSITSFLLFFLFHKSICNSKCCREYRLQRISLLQEVVFQAFTTPSAAFDSRTSTCRRSVHVDEHLRWRSVGRTGQIIRKSGPAELPSSLETRMQWTGTGIRTGTLPSKRERRE